MTDQEVMAELRSNSALNLARREFSAGCARIEQALQQRRPASPVEVRRMEFEAVQRIIAALLPRMTPLEHLTSPAFQAALAEIKELREALLDALVVFDIGLNTEFYKRYADVLASARAAENQYLRSCDGEQATRPTKR